MSYHDSEHREEEENVTERSLNRSDHDDEDEDVSEESQDIYEHLEDEEKVADHVVELVAGEKAGSEWLILDDIYILHKKDKTSNEIFWECSGRRRFNCRFKCATFEGENGMEISFMYKLETHDCGQTKLGPIMHKFKNSLKQGMQSDYKVTFSKVFEQKRSELFKAHSDNPDILERINYELKDKRNYRVLAERAKNKCFPKIPKTHDDIDLGSMNLEHIQLSRTSHPDPEVKDKDIFLLGTPVTAEAFAKAEFKNGDGTFKITPKMFYQVKPCSLLFYS